ELGGRVSPTIAGLDVIANAPEHRVSKAPFVGPAEKTDIHDYLGAYEGGGLEIGRYFPHTGVLGLSHGAELLAQRADGVMVEAATHSTAQHQIVSAEAGHAQRAKAAALATPRYHAYDH